MHYRYVTDYLSAFRSGLSTAQIANLTGNTESHVYNTLHEQREQEHKRKYHREYARKMREEMRDE